MILAVTNPHAPRPSFHTVRRYFRDSYGGLYVVDEDVHPWELWNGGKGGWPEGVSMRAALALSPQDGTMLDL